MNPRARQETAVAVNGAPRTIASGVTIADLVQEVLVDVEARAVAVARNGEIVPRAEWPRCVLLDGDAVEIVRPVQGG